MTASKGIDARVAGSVGFIAVDRPTRANAYLNETLAAMDTALADHVENSGVRVIVVTSASGGLFCSGADLDELGGRGAMDALHLLSLEVFDRLAVCPKPTIAAIDGPAVAGGLELALACDLRIASDRASFAMPETSLGLIPAAGATFRLPRTVGEAVAKQMVLFGAEIDAPQALAHGLVHEVVSSGELHARVGWWAAEVVERDPLALEFAKRAIAMAVTEGPCRDFTSVAQAILYQRRHGPGDEVP